MDNGPDEEIQEIDVQPLLDRLREHAAARQFESLEAATAAAGPRSDSHLMTSAAAAAVVTATNRLRGLLDDWPPKIRPKEAAAVAYSLSRLLRAAAKVARHSFDSLEGASDPAANGVRYDLERVSGSCAVGYTTAAGPDIDTLTWGDDPVPPAGVYGGIDAATEGLDDLLQEWPGTISLDAATELIESLDQLLTVAGVVADLTSDSLREGGGDDSMRVRVSRAASCLQQIGPALKIDFKLIDEILYPTEGQI